LNSVVQIQKQSNQSWGTPVPSRIASGLLRYPGACFVLQLSFYPTAELQWLHTTTAVYSMAIYTSL